MLKVAPVENSTPPAAEALAACLYAMLPRIRITDLLAHLSPLGWEHVNLTGVYIWGAQQRVSETSDGLRPLRAPLDTFHAAA